MSPTQTNVMSTVDKFAKDFRGFLDELDTNPDMVRELTEPRKGNPVTLGPLVTSPEDWADNQVKRAADAAIEWEKNVQHPRRDPLKAAIAAAPKRAEKVRQSLDQGKWEKAMGKVDEDLMYATIRKRGAAAFRAGVQDRKDKVLARAKELQPMVAALKAKIDSMPDVTDADREARLLAARRGMIEIGLKRRGIG